MYVSHIAFPFFFAKSGNPSCRWITGDFYFLLWLFLFLYWLNYLMNRYYFGIRGKKNPNSTFSNFWANGGFIPGSAWGNGQSRDGGLLRSMNSLPAPLSGSKVPRLCNTFQSYALTFMYPLLSHPISLKCYILFLPSPLNPLRASVPWVFRLYAFLLSIKPFLGERAPSTTICSPYKQVLWHLSCPRHLSLGTSIPKGYI